MDTNNISPSKDTCIVDREELRELDKDLVALRREMLECSLEKDIKIERIVTKLDAHVDKHKLDHEELMSKVNAMHKKQEEWIESWNQIKGARRTLIFLAIVIPGVWGVLLWAKDNLKIFNG